MGLYWFVNCAASALFAENAEKNATVPAGANVACMEVAFGKRIGATLACP